MNFKLFKNYKAARRYLPQITLNVLAVDSNLKPSYLWDTFDADVEEIQSYLNELLSTGVLNQELNIIQINENIFITHIRSLQKYLNDVLENNDLYVVDISRSNEVPLILSQTKKEEILKCIIDCFYRCIKDGYNISDCNSKIHGKNGSWHLCNQTTLFGVLLGYPVLYWYEFQYESRNDDLTCLSMLPLKVHKVLVSTIESSESREDDIPSYSSVRNSLKPHLPNYRDNHELYSFSIPDMFSKESSVYIHSWVEKIRSLQRESCLFKELKMVCDTVTLPSVIL